MTLPLPDDILHATKMAEVLAQGGVMDWQDFANAYDDDMKERPSLEYHGVSRKTVMGRLRVPARFLGPLRHRNRLLLDITLDEPVFLLPPHRPTAGSLFDDLQPSVLCYALEEILAEKLRSILQRGKARDYYDVWRLLGEKAIAGTVSHVTPIQYLANAGPASRPSRFAIFAPLRVFVIHDLRDLRASRPSRPFASS